MSPRSSQSEQGEWSRARDAGVSTRRQGLRHRPQLQAQGGGAAAQSSKARGSKRSRPDPPAATDGSPQGGPKRLKVATADAGGSAGPEQVVERRSERLKHCVRVGYRNLDRFGTKEPFWEEIERDNAASRGGAAVKEAKVEVNREKQDRGGGAVREKQVEVTKENRVEVTKEKQVPVLKSWGKRKRRRSRARGDADAEEHEPGPEVWVDIDPLVVQGSREINSWIRKSRREKLSGGPGSQRHAVSTDASTDEIESGDEVEDLKSAVSSPSPAKSPRVSRKRPRIEKRLADIGNGPHLGILLKSAAIERRASEVDTEDSKQDAEDGVSDLENAASRPVATGEDAVGLLEGAGDTDNDEDEELRSSAEVLEKDENDHIGLSEVVPEKVLGSSESGEMTEATGRSDLGPAGGDDALRSSSEQSELHCAVQLGTPAKVSADEGADVDKAQALPRFGQASNPEIESFPGTGNLASDGLQDVSDVRRVTDDAANAKDMHEGGILRATSEDVEDDVSNIRYMVGEMRSSVFACNSEDDELSAPVPHGQPDPCRHDETVGFQETSPRPEFQSEKSTSVADQTTETSPRLVKATAKEIDGRYCDARTEEDCDQTDVSEQLLSNGTEVDSKILLEDQLLTHRSMSQQKIHMASSSSLEAEAEKFDVPTFSSLPELDCPSEDVCRTEQSCLGGWIEDDDRIEDISESLTAESAENASREGMVSDSRVTEAKIMEVRDRIETSSGQTDGMLVGAKFFTGVGMIKALEPTEQEDWQLSSGERTLLPLEGQPQFGGSKYLDTMDVVPTDPHLGVEVETETDIKLPAKLEEVRIGTESQEHEISDLQKALLESFHSFQAPGDDVFVSGKPQLDHFRQLTNNIQDGGGFASQSTSLVKPTEHFEKTAVDCSVTLSALEVEIQPGCDVQDAGCDGYATNISIAHTEEGTSYADKPAGWNSATGMIVSAEYMTEYHVGSSESGVEGTVGSTPIPNVGESLQSESIKAQDEGKGQNVEYSGPNIAVEGVVRSRREGCVSVPFSHVHVSDGHMVDEHDLLQSATNLSSVQAAVQLTAPTAPLGSNVDMKISVSDTGSEPSPTSCVSKSMESLHSAVIRLSNQCNHMPIMFEDAQGSAMKPDDNVIVYCRRKRGSGMHQFDMEEVDQDLGGEDDLDDQSPSVSTEAVVIFHETDSPVNGQRTGSPNIKDAERSIRCPANSHGAVSSMLSGQGGVSVHDLALTFSSRYEILAVSTLRENQNEAVPMTTGDIPGNSFDKTSAFGLNSMLLKPTELTASEVLGLSDSSTGLNPATVVFTSEDVRQETLLIEPQSNCPADGKLGTHTQQVHHPERDRLPAATFRGQSCNLQGPEDASACCMTVPECTSAHETIDLRLNNGRSAEPGIGSLAQERSPISIRKISCREGAHSEICIHRSEALLRDKFIGEHQGDLGIDYTKGYDINQVIISERRVLKGVQACTVNEVVETAPFAGQCVHNVVAVDEEILVIAAGKRVLDPEQNGISESIEGITVDHSKSAHLEPLASQEGKLENTILLQMSSDGEQPVPPDSEAGGMPLLDGTLAIRKDKIDACLKTGMEGEGSEASDMNLASDLHAAYLRSLKCGLCGGSSDGRPPKDMPTEDGKYLRGKSVLDKGEGFEDGEGWLGQLVGPLTSRTGVQGVWVHRQCAIWSPEVYFSGVGRMKNVRAALRRGRYLKCTSCNQPGATIGCCMERCPRTFHLPCARLEGCVFDHVKYLMTCIDHMHLLHPRGQKKAGNDTQPGLCDFEDGTYFHVGGFTKMVRERRIAAASARLKDLEAEEKWVENTAEDEEFVRRERKRLQKDLARMVPVQVGGHTRNEDGAISSGGWESVAGLEDVIQSLKEVVTLPLLYPDVYGKLGVCPPRGVLLHGYPGTGKTHVVRAMVGACARSGQKVAYFARKGADCLGKYVGDSERQLRLLFQIAEECQPSIIFFDEMDGLAPSRSGQNDQTHSSVVSTLLALMDGLNPRGSVVVIGATNRADALDPALRRPGRFDREIFFSLPTTAEREAILALHTQKWVPCPSVGLLSAVARVTSGFAGADLQALCVEAALTALRRACPVSRLVDSGDKGQSVTDLPPLPTVQVRGADWAAALRHLSPPCSRRRALTACGSVQAAPLPKHMMRILLPSVLEVLVALHLDSRVSLPPMLRKVVMLVNQCITSHAGCEGTSLPSNWLELLREWPFESKAGQVFLEALVEAGITCSGDGSDTILQVSVHSSESDCDSSGKDVGEVSKNQTGRHDQLEPIVMPDMLHEPAVVSRNSSLQGRTNIMIAGPPKAGQSLVAAALLHGFESFGHVRVLSLPTMLQEGNGSVTEGLLSILGEAERTSPCLIFMPNIEHWALERVPSEDVEALPMQEAESKGPITEKEPLAYGISEQSDRFSMVASGSWKVLMQFMKSCNSMPIFLLATSELSLEQHPSCVLSFFSGEGSRSKMCGSQTVTPSVVVEVPVISGNLPKILESASEDIARALAVDFARKVRRLMLHLNKVDSIPTSGASDSSFKEVVGEQVAAGSSTEPVVKDITPCEDHEVQIEEEDAQEAKNESLDVIPVDSRQAGTEDVVMEYQHAQLAPQYHHNSGSDIELKSPRRHPFEGISAKQKSLISAIVYCGFQLLHDPQFTELRKATAKLKAGPQVNVLDSTGLDTSNVNKYCQRFSRKDVCPGSSVGSNTSQESSKEIWVRGIVAVGLTAYRGLYSSATEVAREVREVIELLQKRISKSVESGANRWNYLPLTSQAAALEDMLGSWRHEVVRLEVTAGEASAAALNLASTERPSLVHSACGLGEVFKNPAAEENKLPAVSPASGDSNSATEKAPDIAGDGQFQDLELNMQAGTIADEANPIQYSITADEGEKDSVQAGQEKQLSHQIHGKGCKGGDIDSSHGADSQKDTQTSIVTERTNTSPAVCLRRNDVAAKFTKSCLRKLQDTVKDVLADTWRQYGSTTSPDLLNDLITGSAASAMMACRKSVKVYEGCNPFLQDGGHLECGSGVCCAQVNCLCMTLASSPCLATEEAHCNRFSPRLAEGTGETGSKVWKDSDGLLSHSKSTLAMQEPATGPDRRTDKAQNGEGSVCLCPLVKVVRNLKLNSGLQ